MQILYVASEAVPFAKTGGLADVAGTLPIEVANLGHTTSLIMPAYRCVFDAGQQIRPLGVALAIQIGGKTVQGELLETTLPGSHVPVYLVAQDDYYNRPGLYTDAAGKDYIDNCERFVFFCRSVIESIRLLGLHVDLLHLNEWQSGLVAAYLRTEYRGVPGYEQLATLFTIHNLAYQGRFWHWDMLLTGVDWKYFNWHQMEFFGDLNLMKTGLVFSDALSTVSPRYAEEIQTAEQGCGLHGVLQNRRDVLSGILNGVDYRCWNPETDPHLAARYTVDDVDRGKPQCKRSLQRRLGLPELADVPLIGVIGRLVDQKGWDLISRVLQDWAPTRPVQWAVLGNGDPKYQSLLTTLAKRDPQRIAAKLEFSEELAHGIYAGADMFLMPSRFEPCGLSQLYSLKYGTVPIVRATGGLADTITDTNPQTLAVGTANGFSFVPYTVAALAETLERALAAFGQPETWSQLITTGMREDRSWAESARQYVALYERTCARVRQTVCS